MKRKNKWSKLLVLLGVMGIVTGSVVTGCGTDKETQSNVTGDSEVSVASDASGDSGVSENSDVSGITPAESDLYVEKVDGLSSDFIFGVDISSYVAEKGSGVKYYDFEGNELDDQGFSICWQRMVSIMSECAYGIIRMMRMAMAMAVVITTLTRQCRSVSGRRKPA